MAQLDVVEAPVAVVPLRQLKMALIDSANASLNGTAAVTKRTILSLISVFFFDSLLCRILYQNCCHPQQLLCNLDFIKIFNGSIWIHMIKCHIYVKDIYNLKIQSLSDHFA